MSLSVFLKYFLFSFWAALLTWLFISIIGLFIFLGIWRHGSVANGYVVVFLLFSSRYCYSILFSLALLIFLMVGGYLSSYFLLFDPVTFISVHHLHERMWWYMELWASNTPVLPLQPRVVALLFQLPWISLLVSAGKGGSKILLEEADTVFLSLDDNGCHLAAVSLLPFLPCHQNWPNCLSGTQELSYQFSEL